MREAFREQLRASGYLHTLLKADNSASVEARLLQKPVTNRRALLPTRTEDWITDGEGHVARNGAGWLITVPTRVEPTAPMKHYSPYGYFHARISVPRENWEAYNRVTLRIRPVCQGLHAPHIVITFANDGRVKIPDVYHREGHHVVNLENRTWNDCVWEFPDIPRDAVIALGFEIGSYGMERFGAQQMSFEVADLCLEQVENPDVSLGWQGNPDNISFSTSGYWLGGKKTAIVQGNCTGAFEVLEAETDAIAFCGELIPLQNEKGSFGLADFSALDREGRFRIRIGEMTSADFAIAPHVLDEAAWKVLHYIYAERCGFPVGHGHTYCHGDLIAKHDGKRIIYNGGWHDAGDLSQQTLQTGEVVQALFELSRAVDDGLLRARLVEEACWGLDFVLRTRFGDGYRAFSAGMCRWTNQYIGDFDDESVRCHNRSFDNWLLCGVQAYAGFCLRAEDPDLSWVCLDTARQDYAFALARFEAVGMENRVVMEHTYNASRSQYYAVASWSASMLYQATGEQAYADHAAFFGNKLLCCQDTGESGLAFEGFFYRNETKECIVHFNHQSREHIFAQTLNALCITQKEHASHSAWADALRRYGSYVKAMHGFSVPYGMLPAGVHHIAEANDPETFALLHVSTTYEADRENYRRQIESGIQLGRGYCVRQFPVWFSFRGNTAVQLSQAKGAAICAQYFQDQELLEIARDQVYWVAGRNPFCQSLIYGEGSNYAQQYAALCGERMGEMPVGIQTRENEDVPYWPMANNATYKEIWMSTAGHFLRLLADLY